jgi:hypothetical protein
LRRLALKDCGNSFPVIPSGINLDHENLFIYERMRFACGLRHAQNWVFSYIWRIDETLFKAGTFVFGKYSLI